MATTVLNVVGFLVSCVGKFVTGSVFIFFLYQNAIKQTFGYSQTEVSSFSSMVSIGLGLSFIPGLFYDRFGPRRTSLVALVVTTGSYLLIWSTTFNVSYYSNRPVLMAFYFLLSGFGPGFTLMTCLNTNIINFRDHHTGKVVGVLNAFLAGSPSVFATVYYKYFSSLTSKDEKRSDNIRGFMLMLAIMFAVANVLCFIFVRLDRDRSIPHEQSRDQETDIEPIVITSNVNEQENGLIREFNRYEEHIPVLDLLLDGNFILLVSAFTLATTVSTLFGVNITVISKSMSLDSYDAKLTIIQPICNAILSTFIGIFSDYFMQRIARQKLLLSGYVCLAICALLAVVVPSRIGGLMAAAAFCGCGVAIVFSLTPAVIKETTNTVNFGRNYGIACFAMSVFNLPSMILFGALYDNEIKVKGSNDCIGKHCIVGGMSVALGMAVVALLLGLFLAYKDSCRSTCCRRSARGYQELEDDN